MVHLHTDRRTFCINCYGSLFCALPWWQNSSYQDQSRFHWWSSSTQHLVSSNHTLQQYQNPAETKQWLKHSNRRTQHLHIDRTPCSVHESCKADHDGRHEQYGNAWSVLSCSLLHIVQMVPSLKSRRIYCRTMSPIKVQGYSEIISKWQKFSPLVSKVKY